MQALLTSVHIMFVTIARVKFNDLPDTAKSANVITRPEPAGLGGTLVAVSGEIIEVCGSPGEVANDPAKGHQYFLQKDGGKCNG